MGSTNVVLYNVLSVLDLVGHSELLDVSAACYPKASDRLSSHEINRTSWGEGGSYQQINHFSGLCQGLPSSMESRKKTSKDDTKSNSRTCGQSPSNPRPGSDDSSFRILPKRHSGVTTDGMSNSDEEGCSMSLTYGKQIKLKKQKAELIRIYNMLDDLENDFLGDKEETTYIERYMEVKVEKDYMLSAGNPESALEQDDTVKVYGYLGHNMWRCLGPYCNGYCRKNTVSVVNPRIRSQSQVGGIVCTSCNKITVPLIGAVPTSVLNLQSNNPD